MVRGGTFVCLLTVVTTLAGVMPLCCGLSNSDTPIIQTAKGRVRGTRTFITGQQIPVDRFLGIPYAQPPKGRYRFRRPVESQSWTGIRDTMQYPSACSHEFDKTGFSGEDTWNPTVPVSEDCLYLNVWVPKNIQRSMTGLTTLVWIYGGGFYSGSSDLAVYNGVFLAATHNAIVVSMNYRVGAFGFLSLGVPEAPGNVGLMDQSMAMKWVYENIEAFGGDRNKITIFGESAGSASVSYHLLAQPSWSYFNSAIMQSGAANMPWAYVTPEQSRNVSTGYARAVGCDFNEAKKIVDCLLDKSEKELSSYSLNKWKFRPTADGAFITNSPTELLRQKKFKRCNILLGFTTDEGTYFLTYNEKFNRQIQGTPSITQPDLRDLTNELALGPEDPLPNSTLAFQTLLQTYVRGVPPEVRGSNLDVLDDIIGDYSFKCPLIEVASAYAEQNLGVYLYHFDHRSPTNPWPQWTGVMHGYEIEFVFGLPYNTSYGYTAEDKRVSDAMMSYWVTFATNGNPNSQGFGERFWPNYTLQEQRYKVLKSDLLETRQYPRYAQCSFWRDFIPIIDKYADMGISEKRARFIEEGSQKERQNYSDFLALLFRSQRKKHNFLAQLDSAARTCL